MTAPLPGTPASPEHCPTCGGPVEWYEPPEGVSVEGSPSPVRGERLRHVAPASPDSQEPGTPSEKAISAAICTINGDGLDITHPLAGKAVGDMLRAAYAIDFPGRPTSRASPDSGRRAPLYQKCPVCDGQGLVSKPPYLAGDQQSWASSSTAPYPCKRCEGTGTIVAPLPGTPASPDSQEPGTRMTAQDAEDLLDGYFESGIEHPWDMIADHLNTLGSQGPTMSRIAIYFKTACHHIWKGLWCSSTEGDVYVARCIRCGVEQSVRGKPGAP